MLALDHLPDAAWRKSSYSGGNEGGSNCVEVTGSGGLIAIRDSTNPGRGALAFSRAEWLVFVAAVKAG